MGNIHREKKIIPSQQLVYKRHCSLQSPQRNIIISSGIKENCNYAMEDLQGSNHTKIGHLQLASRNMGILSEEKETLGVKQIERKIKPQATRSCQGNITEATH